MSLRKALDEELERGGTGTIEASADGASAEAEVVHAGPIGVRLRRLKIRHPEDRDVTERARDLSERVRTLPRVEPVEVDDRLGGAVLRSEPDEQHDFFQVEAGRHETEVRRLRPREGGGREEREWDMTREQLGDLVDELE